MKLTPDEGTTLFFRKTKMVFKTTLQQSGNIYSAILMTHPPLIGPALHLHPGGPETFFVVAGDYTFTLDGQEIQALKGDYIHIPANTPHKYKSGVGGGQVLVTTPPAIENYFRHISEKLQQVEAVSLDYEFDYAARNGQLFLDKSDHWGHK